jgi:hypothetical protein
VIWLAFAGIFVLGMIVGAGLLFFYVDRAAHTKY